ncbi:hypothetical protein KFK09_007978 [Dendrobium nobile]|uniref:Uncharacterized protein n=1 Tax=Dendrobium nobile TaxID=94219 RepID=A0A8T3BT82_DENNO|nr:hypothetical protein KFK09_007978 [Dendrobium nobile]
MLKVIHRMGMKSLVAHLYDQKLSRIELYKEEFTDKENKWVFEDCQAKYEKMMEIREKIIEDGGIVDETIICAEVLGETSSYIRGLGYGPKPIKKTKIVKSNASSVRETELETSLKVIQEKYEEQNMNHLRIPELLVDLQDYDYSLDMWSLGCLSARMKTNYSTNLVNMIDSLGRGCPSLRNINIASVVIFNDAVCALSDANIRLLNTINMGRMKNRSTIERCRFSCGPILEHPRSCEILVSPRKEIQSPGVSYPENMFNLKTYLLYIQFPPTRACRITIRMARRIEKATSSIAFASIIACYRNLELLDLTGQAVIATTFIADDLRNVQL